MNALGGGRYKATAAMTSGAKRKRGDGDDAGQEELSKRDGKQPMEPMGAPAAGVRREPARSHSSQEGIALGGGRTQTAAATGIRYPTPTGRDEIAEGVAGLLRRNPDGTRHTEEAAVESALACMARPGDSLGSTPQYHVRRPQWCDGVRGWRKLRPGPPDRPATRAGGTRRWRGRERGRGAGRKWERSRRRQRRW